MRPVLVQMSCSRFSTAVFSDCKDPMKRYIVLEKSSIDNWNICTCSKIKIGRGECPSTDLIGHPFGTLFQLSEDGQSLVPVPQCVLIV